MFKRRSKHLALMLVLAMLATLFVGVGVASAKSLNTVNKVVSVGEDFIGDTTVNLSIMEDDPYVDHFAYGDTFQLILPSGVKWNAASVSGPATAEKRTNQVLEVTFSDAVDDGDVDEIIVDINIEIDGYTGDVKVEVDPLDSGVTAGEYLVARVAGGKMTATVDSVKKIAKSNTNGGTIQLREASLEAVGEDECDVTIKLPANFEWWDTPEVEGAGGFADAVIDTSVDPDGRSFTFTFDPADDRSQRGILYISTPIKAGRSANFGEIEVAISGENADGSDIVDADLVVAEYVDWGLNAKISEVKDLTSGKFDQVTGKITLKENIAATLISGRDLSLEVPSWVKITDVKSLTDNYDPDVDVVLDASKNYVDFTITGTPTTTKRELTFKLELSIQGDQEGDIEATIKGAGVEEMTLLIAKAVKPVTAACDNTTDVKIGVQDQAVADVVITEGIKEAIRKDTVDDIDGNAGDDGQIVLSLTEGATFADTPTITITEGNLEIVADDVRLGTDDTTVVIPVKSEGSKISSIKVSDIKLTLDRTIPEGDLWFKVGGNAVVENSRAAADADVIEDGEFKVGTAAKVVIANVVTPAPGEKHAVAVFTIGSVDYTINALAQPAMDVAPYISGDRTYLPIRYVAYALGIDDNNILWDGVNQTVTLMKGDKVVQLKIGSTTLLVNGAAVTMDVAPQINSDRTMLPIRFVAQAFGASAGWDAATQQVTITL